MGWTPVTGHIAACQFEPTIGDVSANLAAMRSIGGQLPEETALAMFPELCITGYDLSTALELATPVPGPQTDLLVDFAADLGCQIAVGLSERDGDRYFNTTVVVSESGVEATYRKRYLWGNERETFSAGETPTTVETAAGRVGLCCCYDLNFPEVGLEYARRGCDVLAVNAAWRTSFLDDWTLLSRSRARDGPYYVVAANHTGEQVGREHGGHSLVAGPDGHVHSQADTTPGIVSAPVMEPAIDRARSDNPVQQTRRTQGDW